MLATSLAVIATRGWSLRSCRAYPKYGITAVVREADARRTASIMMKSSMMFSAGGNVGWKMNTSWPRMFVLILTEISASGNR